LTLGSIFIHGILTPLPMVYRPPYPWYIDPPTHGILTSLPMEYRPPYLWYIKPSLMVLWTPLFLWKWGGGSIYHEGVQNTMKKNWPRGRGRNTIWNIEPGVKISYVNLPWGSKYHMTPGVMFVTHGSGGSKIYIIDHNPSWKENQRQNRESFWIHELQTLHPVSYGILNPMVNWHMIFWPRVQFSIWYFDPGPGVNFFSLYFEPPHGKLNPPPHFHKKRGVHNTKIPYDTGCNVCNSRIQKLSDLSLILFPTWIVVNDLNFWSATVIQWVLGRHSVDSRARASFS
jgi:hypothetical protein